MWRGHLCLPRRHSCRRLRIGANPTSAETNLGAADTSVRATSACKMSSYCCVDPKGKPATVDEATGKSSHQATGARGQQWSRKLFLQTATKPQPRTAPAQRAGFDSLSKLAG